MERREHSPTEMTKPEPGLCEIHRLRVSPDCPKCVDTLIAMSLDLEEGDWS